MKQKLNNPDFEYRLYCNNICGATHFNMMLPVRVGDAMEGTVKRDPVGRAFVVGP